MLSLYQLDTAKHWKESTKWKREDGHKQFEAKAEDGNFQKEMAIAFSMGNFGNRKPETSKI